MALSLPLGLHAASTCPLTLPPALLRVDQVPSGWRPVLLQDGPRLSSAGIVQGPYGGGGYLKPAKTSIVKVKGGGETTVATWDFGTPPYNELWLYCEYADVLELYRPVDAETSRCTITSTREGNKITAMKLKCD